MTDQDIKPQRRKLPPIHSQNGQTNISFQNNENEETSNEVKPKRKIKSVVIEQDLHLPQTSEDENLKPKKKKKRNKEKLDLESELEGVLDDIEDMKDTWKLQAANSKIITEISSPQNNNLYIEKKDKFVLMDKEFKLKIEKIKDKKELEEMRKNNSRIALNTHKTFLKVSLFLHGLLAGIALFQIIITYILFYGGSFNFLNNYMYLAEPMQCSFAFLFIFCLISSLDRYDPTSEDNPNTDFKSRISPGSFVIVIYFIGLVFSLSTAYADDTITLYKVNPSTINSTITFLDKYLQDWQILNLIRAIFAILGWMLINFQPYYDRMSSIIDF